MPLQIANAIASQLRDTKTLAWATCWRITLTKVADRVYRFTDHVEAIELATGEVFVPPDGMDATAVQRKEGLKPQNRDVRGLISDSQITDADLTAGLFVDAIVEEYLVDVRSAAIAVIETTRFYIRSTQFDGAQWVAEIDGAGSLYTQPVGEWWGAMCRVEVFSQGPSKCNVNPATFLETVAISVVNIANLDFAFTIVNALWNESGFGNDGTVTFLSGPNRGFNSRIQVYTAAAGTGSARLQQRTPYAFQVGDLVSLLPGCNKQAVGNSSEPSHCVDRFDNILNFQGEPFIPGGDRARAGVIVR